MIKIKATVLKGTDDAIKLTPTQEEGLRNITIDPQGPGTILANFQMFLEFIAESYAVLSAKHYMPPKVLDSLNQRMIRPMQHDLRRPLQKSYPYLNGLYLLMRASGLARVDGTGKKPVLTLNEPIYSSWQELNPTERYFALLETWLLRASPEIIGERGSGRFNTSWFGLQHVLIKTHDEDFQSTKGINLVEEFRYTPELYNLALMDLFGLISLQSGEPIEGKGWKIDGVQRTLWGELLLAGTMDYMVKSRNFHGFDAEGFAPYGELQPILQPYFPEWQNTLALPQHTFQGGLFIFKVALKKSIWRRIAIPASGNLDELSYAILDAYDFDGDHLHEFIYTNQSGAEERAYHAYMGERPWTHEVVIGDLPIQEGSTLVYHYDFGADWRFDVTLEKIDTENDTIKELTILEEHGEAPQEYPDYDDDD